MCGFAGVIAWDERYRVSSETLAKMSAAIAHRGPDGEGFHLTQPEKITPDCPQVALAFRRLAILDPDPRSDQPFTDGRHWLVFNGEIYNFRDLKKELSQLRPDYAWRTTGDTEVLLLSYAVWGEKCVEHLNGMFAFAVWDEVEKSLFLARDRMGQKPLYRLRRERGYFAFASELTALRVVKPTPSRIDELGLIYYLQYGTRGTSGISGDVTELRSGSSQSIHVDASKSTGCSGPPDAKYFDASAIIPGPRTVADTRKLVTRAVERQLVSDVPLGVFLSGGMDSSIVAACARGFGPVRTFSIRFDDPAYDESHYARQIAGYLRTEHTEFDVKPDAIKDLPRLASIFGEPFGDSSAIPTHCLCHETSKHVKVALSGDGGDELFGGYDRYRAMRLGEKFKWAKRFSSLGASFTGGHPKSNLTRLGRLLSSLADPPPIRYRRIMQIFSDSILEKLSPGIPLDEVLEYEFEMANEALGDHVLAALTIDRVTYLPDDLLTKVDRCSMMHGLEVRSPFMDHELVQFAAGLTTDQLLKGGPKRMLREAFKDDLPAWVFKRKKMGFAVPIGEWFRGPLRAMLRDTLFSSHAFGRVHFDMKVVERLVEEHESQRVDHSQRLYALLMLELWWDTVRG